MSENPQSKRRGWALPLVPLIVLGALYVAGYFALGKYLSQTAYNVGGHSFKVGHVRSFRFPMIQLAYYPMGWLESRIRGENVVLWARDGVHVCEFEIPK
jgi:hypothetical protein